MHDFLFICPCNMIIGEYHYFLDLSNESLVFALIGRCIVVKKTFFPNSKETENCKHMNLLQIDKILFSILFGLCFITIDHDVLEKTYLQ